MPSQCFWGFFAIMNPIANVPIFLSLTAGDDEAAVRKIALRAFKITRMMGLILAVIGTQMLIEGIRGAFDLSG
jgi:multiple antibiotic resistance protein